MQPSAAWLVLVLGAVAACDGGRGSDGDAAPVTATSASLTTEAATVVSDPPMTSASTMSTATATTSTASTTTTSTTTTTTTGSSGPSANLLPHPRQAPFAPETNISYAHDEHHDYPAADIFASPGCGTPVLAATDGVIEGFEAATTYDRALDDPSMRGGNWVAIAGSDGVRYYVAHLETVDPAVTVGERVSAGDPLGTMGSTGRSGACHTHFALSPTACPVDAWWVRRGVVWPADYLDAWRAGEDRSPAPEIDRWLSEHPGACDDPEAAGFPIG
ncbi:MAG: M23 family metallopeptidase [Desertimonas sp.]